MNFEVLHYIYEEVPSMNVENFIGYSLEGEETFGKKLKKLLMRVDNGEVEQVYDDLERDFWKNIANRTPIYGADSPGSLFHEDASWNMGKFETMLDVLGDILFLTDVVKSVCAKG